MDASTHETLGESITYPVEHDAHRLIAAKMTPRQGAICLSAWERRPLRCDIAPLVRHCNVDGVIHMIRLAIVGTIVLACSAATAAATPPFRDCSDCPEMIVIRAGSFVMGSPKEEAGRSDAESPQHKVTIAGAFAIARYDVTRAQFAVFAQGTSYDARDSRCDWRAPQVGGKPINQTDKDPVVCVDWNAAHAYAAWLSKRTGKPYRLPTEAEWEYAARAGSATSRPWGDKLTRDFANTGSDPCCGAFAEGKDRWLYTSPVGSFPPNANGLSDMIGNVWQWVQDCGHSGYVGAPADGSAWMSADCTTHMVRGGAWFQGPESARSAARAADQTGFRAADIGFRVALSLPEH